MSRGINEIATSLSTSAPAVTRDIKAFSWTKLCSLFAESATQWSDKNAPRLGAALAFYTVLSIAPLLVVVAAIGSFVFGSLPAQRELTRQVYAVAGPMGAKVVGSVLEGAHNAGHGVLATILGAAILIFSASGILIELRDALNTLWDLPVSKRTRFQNILDMIRERLFAAAAVLSIGMLLLLSLTLNVFISGFARQRLIVPGAILHVGVSVVSFSVVTFLFAAIFKVIPRVKLEWIDVALGAFVTSVLFTIGRLLIAFYLERADFNTTYGTAASTMALLIWVYYSSQIFLFGAALTRVFGESFGSKSWPGRNMERAE